MVTIIVESSYTFVAAGFININCKAEVAAISDRNKKTMLIRVDGLVLDEPFLVRVFLKPVTLAFEGQGFSPNGRFSGTAGMPTGQHHGPELCVPVATIQFLSERQQ
jgi:hypothetical protein